MAFRKQGLITALMVVALTAASEPAGAISYSVGAPSRGLDVLDLAGVIQLEGPLADGSRVAVSGFALSGRVEERTSCTPGGLCTVPFIFDFTLDLDLAKESFLDLRAIDGALHPSGLIHLILQLENPFSTQPSSSVSAALEVTEFSQLFAQFVGSDCFTPTPVDCTVEPLANVVSLTRLEIDGPFDFANGLPPTFPDVGFLGIRAIGVVPEPRIAHLLVAGVIAFLRSRRHATKGARLRSSRASLEAARARPPGHVPLKDHSEIVTSTAVPSPSRGRRAVTLAL